MLENKLSRVGWGGVWLGVGGGRWLAGLTKNKTKPSSWGLAMAKPVEFECMVLSDISISGLNSHPLASRIVGSLTKLNCPKISRIKICCFL